MKTSKDDYENCDCWTERSANDRPQSCAGQTSAASKCADSDIIADDMSRIVSTHRHF